MIQGHGLDPYTVASRLNPLLEAAYLEGLRRGLEVAERIRGWLTLMPDTERQAQQRKWADRAIEELREEIRWAEIRAGEVASMCSDNRGR